MARFHEMCLRKRLALHIVTIIELSAARERARGGDRDAAIAVMRQAADETYQQDGSGLAFGPLAFWWRRCWSGAPRAIWPKPKRLSTCWRNLRADGSAASEITLLARARGEGVAYLDFVSRYRAMARALDFAGHIEWAGAI